MAAGYGIKITASDRDRWFEKDWDDVVLDLEGGQLVTVPLSPSFWRRCSKLRSAVIGRWLMEQGVAPWDRGNPPGIAITRVAGNRFSARIMKRQVQSVPAGAPAHWRA